MRYLVFTLFAVLAAAVALSLPVATAGDESEMSAEQAKASARVPLDVPAAEKKRLNPHRGNVEATKYAAKLFSSQCTMCHGKNGDGSGDLAASLEMPVPDFTSPSQQKEWTDGEIHYVIINGHGRMPATDDRFEDEHVWGMVNHIRSLSGS